MAAENKYLDQLNANSSAYKVKAKAIEKVRPKTSPKKEILYQSLMLQDDRPWNTLPEERLRLKVIVPDADLAKVNAYLGCSYCNARGDTPIGRTYLCKTWLKRDSVSSPRLTFTCEVADGTGTLGITAFTGNSSKFLKVSDEDMFRIKHTENYDAFATIKERLSTEQVVLELGPNSNLARNNVLQWVLKNVCIEAKEDEGQNEHVMEHSREDESGTVDVQSGVAIEREGSASRSQKDSFISKQSGQVESYLSVRGKCIDIEEGESAGGYEKDDNHCDGAEKGEGSMMAMVEGEDTASGVRKGNLNTEVVTKKN